MAEIINGVPIGDLPGIESVPDDSMLVVEFLGKAYHMPGAVLRQMIQDVLDAMGSSVDDVTEARLTAAIETVLASGKYNGVSPSVEVLDEEDGTSVIHIIDAFGVKKYPVEVKGARNAVQYVEQELTEEQKAQVRENIGIEEIGNSILVELSGNPTDGYTALLSGEAVTGDELDEMAKNGSHITGVATESLVFQVSNGINGASYTVPNGTIFSYGNAIVTGNPGFYGTGGVHSFEFRVCLQDYNFAIAYKAVANQDEKVWVSATQATHMVFRLGISQGIPAVLYGTQMLYGNSVPNMNYLYTILAESQLLNRPVFCYQVNMPFYTDDGTEMTPYSGVLFSLKINSAYQYFFEAEHEGYVYRFTVKQNEGYSCTAEPTEVYKKVQSKADDLKAEDGTLFLLSAGEPIGAGVPLPTGNADDCKIFIADLNTSTYEDIKAADDAGKICYALWGGYTACMLTTLSPESAIFTTLLDPHLGLYVKFTKGTVGVSDFGLTESHSVLYEPQSLTDAQKAQARENIGALSTDDIEQVLQDVGAGNVYVSGLFSAKYADIKAAYEAGKACFITYGALLCTMTVFDAEKAEFVGMLTPHIGMKGTLYADGTYNFQYVHSNAVQTVEQSLTDAQKAQARKNIGAGEPVVDTVTSQLRKEFAVGYSEEEISNVTEWQTATSPSGFNARQRSCCYGNGYYVIAGTSGQMAYRTKETAWVKPAAFTSGVITGLAYGNGRFLAVDSNGGVFTAATPDATWEQVFTASGVIESVRYLNNRFVAVGDNGFFATSLDGKEWTQKTAFTTNTLIDSAYGNGWFIAVGASGSIFRSINLNDWLDVSIADFGDIRTVLFTVNGFVIGGAGGKIAYSTDGKSWSMATNNTTSTVNWIRGFAYAEKRIYAVMYISTGGGEIWVSKDGGATWAVDRSVSGRLWCVAHGDGVFFTSGDGGAIYEMDLGIKWQNEEPDENAWYRFVATLSNGERIVSESYKSKGEKQKAVLYEAQELTDVQKAQARTNIGALSAGDVDTVLQQAKDSGQFDGKDGYTPVKGVDYFDGEDGKTAYAYAQDGGYTGTEAEFAAKLASDSEPLVVTLSGNDTDGYTADKTVAEIYAARNAGRDVYMVGGVVTYQLSYLNSSFAAFSYTLASRNAIEIISVIMMSGVAPTRIHQTIDDSYVKYTAQSLDEEYKLQARTNIGAMAESAAGTDGILPARLRSFQAEAAKVGDPNYATETGFYYVYGLNNRPPFSQDTNIDYRVLTTAYSDQWLQQIATDFRCGDMFLRRRENGTWTPWVRFATETDLSGYVTTSGNANTSTMPLGFASRTTGATWGNTIGTSFTSWNDPTGGSIDFRQDNPSSGKMSIKVDGRVYVNEGLNPVMAMEHANDYWGMTSPDGENNAWIRTTTSGIIPFQSGGAGSGHCYLGTSSWYFGESYIDRMYGTNLSLAGRAYMNEWIQCNSEGGLLFPNHNGLHIMANTVSTYTPLRIVGEKNSYNGVLFGNDSTGLNIMSHIDNQGLYNESMGRWIIYYTRPTDKIGIGTSGLSGSTITLGGSTNVQGILTQGSPSEDASVALMNRFQSDLFIQGSGAAPNGPTVAGFYLGKSASDENRHMDIVSGGDYSYIDFNKAGRAADYDARLLVNVANGYTEFMWGSSGEITQRVLNIQGSLRKNGVEVATQNDVVEAANGSLKVTLSGNDTDGYSVDKTYAEIQTAWNAGRYVYVTNGAVVYNPSLVNVNLGFIFTYTRATGDGVEVWSVLVNNLGTKPTVVKKTITA